MRDAESGLGVVLMVIDREHSTLTMHRADGRAAVFPLPGPPSGQAGAIARVYLSPDETSFTGSALLAMTTAGDAIVVELPRGPDQPRPAGRPVVYLDQNHWSTVSKASDPSSNIPAEEREAAMRLAELARQGQVVLPASSGHYAETTRWTFGPQRLHLGLTILQLSRGWQLRDPLQVRRDELASSFDGLQSGGPPQLARAVITLAPGVLHESRGTLAAWPLERLPPAAAEQYRALLSATALIETILDGQTLPAAPPSGWASVNQRFSDWLSQQPLDSRQKRGRVDLLLASDLRRELAEEARRSGVGLEDFKRWLAGFATHVAELPALGLYREVIQDRHLNGAAWKPNDLTDIVYLTTAAAYCDVVVCERSIGSAVQRGVRRLGRGSLVFRRIRDAMPSIEGLAGALGEGTPE